jgi:hypothetical protein
VVKLNLIGHKNSPKDLKNLKKKKKTST